MFWDCSHRTYKCLEVLFCHGIWRVPGDIIELGVFRGATTAYLAETILRFQLDKKIYACDTFEGLPFTEGNLAKGRMACSLERFVRLLQEFPHGDVSSVVQPVVGRVEQTLNEMLTDKTFSFAWVDLDLESPTRFSYKWLENRMTVGGVIGFHDYGFHNCPGIKKVVDNDVDWNRYRRLDVDAINTVFIERILQ